VNGTKRENEFTENMLLNQVDMILSLGNEKINYNSYNSRGEHNGK
jgi:hypothetical protein